TASEPFIPRRTVVDEAACFLRLDDCCVFRTQVDHDVLRGRGRPIPQGLGAWLDVLPGCRRSFDTPGGLSVAVTWPDSALLGPSIGSVRRAVQESGGEGVDDALLVFDRRQGLLDVHILKPSSINEVDGWRRVALVTGFEAADESVLVRQLMTAVGATS